MEKNFVTYEEFGAVGDGKHDDFEAIYKTHEYANREGLPVKAKDSATYYIENTEIGEEGKTLTVQIKTDVDWGKAHFIIDDTGLENMEQYSYNIFEVKSDYPKIVLTGEDELSAVKLDKGYTKVELGTYHFPALIVPEDDSNVIFRRFGYVNRFYGEPTREILVVDAEGNVDKDTPIIFKYNKISKLSIYRIDETPLTVKGGIFTTVKPRCDRWATGIRTAYIKRGLLVSRSNVIVEGTEKYNTGGVKLSEYLNGELAGCAYAAFFTVAYATNVIYKDCVFTSNMTYGHSSYIHQANYSNKVVYDHCTLSNFWVKVLPDNDTILEKRWDEKEDGDGFVLSMKTISLNSTEAYHKMIDRGALYTRMTPPLYWGSGASNFCKNLELRNGTSISRFDAHQGLYNGKIEDSVLSYIAITGTASDEHHTTLDIKNTTVLAPSILLTVRGDYGSTWLGDINLQNVDVYLPEGKSVVMSKEYRNWYFGYKTGFPNVTLDNVAFYRQKDFSPGNSEKPEPISEKLDLFATSPLPSVTRMHLKEAHVPPYLELRDMNGTPETAYTLSVYTKTLSDGTRVFEPFTFKTGDGYIDEPWDMDGDGKIGNLTINGQKLNVKEIIDYLGTLDRNFTVDGYLADGSGGFPATKLNFNVTEQPDFVKILNNKAGHKYSVVDTSGMGVPSREGLNDDGGFFGRTKFYYSDGEYFVGTNHSDSVTDKTPYVFEKNLKNKEPKHER